MIKAIFVLLFLLPFIGRGQIIKTIAGDGSASNNGDGGPATASTLDYPVGGAFDRYGNYYFTTGGNGCTVREILTSGIITTVAGMTGVSGNSGDGGAATNAKMNNPQGVAVDSNGNIYIVDEQNENVRKVDFSTGIISTIAGNGTDGFAGDGGPATAASFSGVQDICVDKAGNIFLADYQNNRIRKISITGTITTAVGGSGSGYYNGDGGLADTSNIKAPTGICVDIHGNLFIAENSGLRVRKVNASGIISTIAGNGSFGFAGNGGLGVDAQTVPFKVAADRFGNIFIMDTYVPTIRMVNPSGLINLFAGNGTSGFSGDGGPATAAEISTTGGGGLVNDSCGNLFIADLNNRRIREVAFPHCDYLSVQNGIKENEQTIFPIPAYDVLNINGIKTKSAYRVLNIVGAALQCGTLNTGNNSISIQSLANGLYLLEITDEEGKRTVTKIIKE